MDAVVGLPIPMMSMAIITKIGTATSFMVSTASAEAFAIGAEKETKNTAEPTTVMIEPMMELMKYILELMRRLNSKPNKILP